ncbi:phosphatase PAP2 family protein [Kribbella sp. NPDC023855]|uniref:phosphatase PAP2 family protein n=1 Tax=Kribbella sp. NPDC023855 TaxID=3154698 RepID=UPI0033C36682
MAEQTRYPATGDTARRVATRTRRIVIAREAGLITSAVILYFVVRGLIDGRVAIAFGNADRVIGLERWAGIFVEPQLQAATTDHSWLVETLNAIYIYGHWPVVVITLAWLLLRHRDEYARFRNAILVSGAIGLVIFAAFPVAPPRFLPEFGFVDTVTENSSAYRVLQPPAFVNQYAAVPSLHFGWNLLMGIAWASLAGSAAARLFGVVMPVLMLAAIVLTANHYLVDGIAGGTIALIGLAAGNRIANGRGPRRSPEESATARRRPWQVP